MSIDNVRMSAVFRLFGMTPNTKEWADANLEAGQLIKAAGSHHEAVEYLLNHATYYQSIAALELIVLNLNDDKKRADVLKQGIDWPYTDKNGWTSWRYYDDLSIVGYYNGALDEAIKAYSILVKYQKFPPEHAERIRNNAQYYESWQTDTSLSELEQQLKQLSETTVFERYFHHVPSLAHFVYLRGVKFGMHHYIAIASAAAKMRWSKIMLYTDVSPRDVSPRDVSPRDEEGEEWHWWKKALQVPNVQLVHIQPPKFINKSKVQWKQHQADMIRLLVLKYFGGVYLDLDMLTLKSFKGELKQLHADKTIVMCREDNWKVANCFIGCLPQSPFIDRWIEAYKAEYGTHEDQWGGLSVQKPHALIKEIPALILPTHKCLPFDYFHVDFFVSSQTTIDFSDCYTVHLWDTEQQKRGVLPTSVASFISSNSTFAQMFGHYVSESASKEKQASPLIVSVEGNIGSGKSTLLEQLQSVKFALPHIIIQEDVKGWTSYTTKEGKNLIECYYQDPVKMSYCFQSMALVSRIHQLCTVVKQNPNTIIITERSHLTDAFVFAKRLYETQKMSEIEWLTYQRCYEQLMSLVSIDVQLVVYNQATPDVCFSRIQQRKRKGEECIPRDLIELLHTAHEDWMRELPSATKQLTLNGNIDDDSFERMTQIQQLIDVVDDMLC